MSLENRLDLRNPNQIRPYSCEIGFINDSNGSSRFSQGLTEVIAVINGPGQPKQQKQEKFDKTILDIFISLYGQDESNNTLIKNYKYYLNNWIESSIDVEKYPRTIISIRLEVVRDDGALLSTMFNASIIACVDAGIIMLHIPLSITITKTNKDFFIDPTLIEEKQSICTFINVLRQDNNKGSIIVGSQSIGICNINDIKTSIEIASKCLVTIKNFVDDLIKN